MSEYLDKGYTVEELEKELDSLKKARSEAWKYHHGYDYDDFPPNDLYDDCITAVDAGDYEYYQEEINKVENAIGFKKRQNTENNNIKTRRSLNNISNTNSDLLNYDKQVETLYKKLNHAKDEEHIGIMGEWGSGKSFLISRLREKLNKEGIPNVVIKATATQHGNTIWYTVLLSVSQYYLNNNQDNYSCKYIPNEFIKLFKKYKFILKSIFSKKSPLLLLLNILVILLGVILSYCYKNILISLPTLPAYKTLYSIIKETFSLNNNFFNKFFIFIQSRIPFHHRHIIMSTCISY